MLSTILSLFQIIADITGRGRTTNSTPSDQRAEGGTSKSTAIIAEAAMRCFRSYFTPKLMESLVRSTNERAVSEYRRLGWGARAWVPTSVSELHTFLGLLVYTGFQQRKRLRRADRRRLRDHMPMQRFSRLLEVFHTDIVLVDSEQSPRGVPRAYIDTYRRFQREMPREALLYSDTHAHLKRYTAEGFHVLQMLIVNAFERFEGEVEGVNVYSFLDHVLDALLPPGSDPPPAPPAAPAPGKLRCARCVDPYLADDHLAPNVEWDYGACLASEYCEMLYHL